VNIHALEEKAAWVRRQILETIASSGRGHIGGAFSCADILVALYYAGILRYDPCHPDWSHRDRFILSKGHSCVALYVILSDLGFFPCSELGSFCQRGSMLGGHPDRRIPGIEADTGSLGHGLGIGAGLALGARLDQKDFMTVVMLGDGECYEGAEYVFMCAANTSGAAVMDKTPLAHVTPNVVMNTLMLDAAYSAKVRKFLFISSNTVYPAVDHPVAEDEMVPGDLFEKYFCVGWMKQFTEILCRMYAEKIRTPMQMVVVRPANIYGPDDDFEWETSHVLPALIRKGKKIIAVYHRNV